jgi:Domain of unknown function (DUF5753)
MNFPKNNAVVYLEGMGSSTYLELPEKIDYFRRHAAELAKVALDPPNRSSSISQEGTNDGAGVRHR